MKYIFSIFLIFICCVNVFAQQPSKEELQRKNQELSKEIEEIRQNLAKTSGDRKSILGLMAQLNRKIEARNQIIANIKGEVYYLEKDILHNYKEIDTLKKELDTLKVQYAKSIVYAYKNRSNYDFLNFLFSAHNFNDAFKRIAYLKTYRQYREQQAAQIKKTNELLQKKIESLTGKKQDKSKALNEQNKQMSVLEEDKKEKDQVISQLQAKEKELSNTIKKKEKQRQDVARQIKRIISEELAKARRLEQERQKRYNDSLAKAKTKIPPITTSTNPPVIKNPPPTTVKKQRPPSELENTPEGLITSTEFEKNRGSLPWPVDQRVVTLHFGVNSIPAKPRNINVVSDGITMETAIGAAVKAIFDGEVASIMEIADKMLVMIKHGKYFSAYSNLESAVVKKGQKVTRGQVIGKAGSNDDGVGEMELIITNEKGANLNPESWVRH